MKPGVTAILDLAKDLKNAAQVLQRAEYRAINKVASKAVTRSRREIVSRVNLTQTYVRERMELRPATPRRPEAFVVARVRHTRLATYGAKQVTVAAKRAKGDKLRGIGAGRKQAGVMVGVTRAKGKRRMPGAFLVPLRAGKAGGLNGMGVFIREGKRIRHLYGPSVDQVFRGILPALQQQVADDLEKAVLEQTEYEVRKALKL